MDRQKYEKIGAFTGPAFHGNMTAEAFNDAMGNRQSHPRSLVLGLCGEKGFKDPMQDIGWYTMPCIADSQFNIFVVITPVRSQGSVFICGGIGQADAQFTRFALHGLGGIGAEVHDDLQQLGGIHSHLGLALNTALNLD